MKKEIVAKKESSNQSALFDAIKAKTGKKKTPFHKLDPLEQRLVLRYIRDNDLNIKPFGQRWYDILSDKFCVDEYSLEEADSFSDLRQIKTFDTFEDFYDYIEGDLYSFSCYFGYNFTDEQKKKYGINIKNINFDSFLNETIGKYTFENVMKLQDEKEAVLNARAKSFNQWIDDLPEITTAKQLKSIENKFVSRFGLYIGSSVFFSLLLRKRGRSFKEAAIEYFCKEGRRLGLSIDEILIYYGRETAQFAVDNYIGSVAYPTRRKHISLFKDVLKDYDEGPNTLKRSSGFEPELQLYHIKDDYYNKEGECSYGTDYYFFNFEEFAKFLSGNLKGVIMPFAPVSKEEVSKYTIDDTTILPLGCSYERYKLTKEYKNGEFIVSQKWIDEENKIIAHKTHKFDKVFDFIHFLKGDLSDSDLIMCDGIENLKRIQKIRFDGAKVRSNAAEELKISKTSIPEGRLATVSFDQTQKYELATYDVFQRNRSEDDNYDGKLSYITDIHLLHRTEAFKCQSMEDANYVIRHIASEINKQSTRICLIGGDTSSDFKAFKAFVHHLKGYNEDSAQKYFIFTLGNHELWPFAGSSVKDITKEYRDILKKYKMYLIQNSILYISEGSFKEITEEELISISEQDLREKMRNANLIIFGGIGFAGQNDRFNANMGIYREALSREQEIKESNSFLELYRKVSNSLYGKNVVIMTHMPLRDWAGDIEPKEGFIYISGHNHRNYYFDDGKTRIYADNQIGYKGKNISIKKVFLNFDYDWFSDYEDGIHEITKNDYETFYRGVNEPVTFKRDHEKLFMIKRENAYMFFMQTSTGRLSILNGGAIRRAGSHSLEYFYENILKYTNSIKCFLSKYDAFQKQVSSEVKRIGGDGRIHGCIVDIDFWNHLYLNPLDGSITPYYALSMVDKYVYSNFQSLLKYKCPQLFKKYEQLINEGESCNSLVLYNQENKISDLTIPVYSTEMYRVSRILNGLQYTTKYNIVRIWSDAMIQDVSEESGRLIVSSIVNPESVPQVELKEEEVNSIYERFPRKYVKRIIKARVKEEKEKAKTRETEYKQLIKKETNDSIKVLFYRGAKEKADYKCKVCGHEWSMRPDHFRDRRKYTCPNCSLIERQKAKINAGSLNIESHQEKVVIEPIQTIEEINSRALSFFKEKEVKEIDKTKDGSKPGIKTQRKEERSDNAELIVLNYIHEKAEDKYTPSRLAKVMLSEEINISKNAVLNAVSRMIDSGDLYLSLNGFVCISIKGYQRLKKR